MDQEYRFVYVIDLSSSLATVGNTKADILLSEAFQTRVTTLKSPSLRNSLHGIVQPFSLQVSTSTKIVMRPLLHLTVLADCSQFASNINVIPVLTSHPTMRVFVQNVIISAKNIDQVIKKLHSEFLSFQRDTSNFRKLLKQKRLKTDYDLDVGGEVLDTTSLLPEGSGSDARITGQPKHDISATHPENISRMSAKKKEDTSYHSSKKEVWGIGKSGANLSRILHAGHFALKLLPSQGRAEVVLITDGAMKSNVHDNTFVRQFAEEDITCHIVQIGYSRSFIAGRNFGFVPDTEILRFLSRATGGTFMYSEQCRAVGEALLRTSRAKNDIDSKPVTYIPSSDTSIQPPNVYHQNLFFRECILSKHASEAGLQINGEEKKSGSREMSGNNTAEIGRKARDRYNFPWDPDSKPPEDEFRLLKYREYPLPVEFSHVIAARAREGFTLQSVTFDDSTGTRKSDPGMSNLQASDFAAVRKEKIQLIMVLHWQPNVTIEYRIRATWLPTIIGTSSQRKNEKVLLSSGIFAGAKAPRAEIYVRTDNGFAHVLKNWDSFRRRAQMMGVVTGSIYFGEAYALPTFAKVDRLKTYLVDIFEGDEMLKTVIGFNSKFLLSHPATDESSVFPSGSDTENTQEAAFIDAFKAFWEKINATEFRTRTRCWYDYECLDLLVGDVSPYMAPKLISMYNQDFVSNVETEILSTVERVKKILSIWADIEGEDGTFVRLVHRFAPNLSSSEETYKNYFLYSLGYPVSFCEVRIRREYGRMITLRLLLFNVDVQARKRTVDRLIQLLKTSSETNAPCNRICQRPFSSLLMRDPKHFQDLPSSVLGSAVNRDKDSAKVSRVTMARARSWYLPNSVWLTSEYIVRDYLKHMTWSWQTDNYQDQYHKSNKMMPIHDLAFQFLCQARLDQGYQLVSPRPDSTHFYQEISLPSRDGRASLCAIQYFIWKDADSGRITTELWMEPSGNLEFDEYDLVKTWTVEPDRKTVSQLVTFDQLHAVGRSKGKGYFKDQRSGYEIAASESTTTVMMLPHLFDVATVLRANKFAVASFGCPKFNAKPEITENNIYRLRIDTALNTPNHGTTVSPNVSEFLSTGCDRTHYVEPDSLLDRNKELIAKLSIKNQNNVLLHYYMEYAFSSLTDGEIVMSLHDLGTRFWLKLTEAMRSLQGDSVSNTRFASNLRDTQCYIKVFDVRSTVVILFPSLEAVASGALSLEDTDEAGSEQDRVIDYFMFECMRQKPMKPTKSAMLFTSPLDEANRSRVANFLNDDEVTIKEVDCLVHKSDGLGDIWRPRLFQGEFRACSSYAQLSERVLRVAQDVTRTYSKSFVKSLYANLVRGLGVDDDDLSKALEICNESLMKIDITDFVNMMTCQERSGKDFEAQAAEVNEAFVTIFQYYFEPVQTNSGSRQNLFYYKPVFGRTASVEPQTAEEKAAFIVDLATCCNMPLLIRLECSYETVLNGSRTSVTVPVPHLPCSYSEIFQNGNNVDFDPSSVWGDSLSLDSRMSCVTLHLVCLNLPWSDDSRSRPSIPAVNESLIKSMKSQPECFWELNQDQQEVLAVIEARIRWLLTAETIHGLLKSETITKPLLTYVERKLQDQNPFADFTTSIVVPFYFVKSQVRSRRQFMDEMEKDNETKTFTLQRLENYFYVSKEKIYNMRGEAILSAAASPILDTETIDVRSWNSDNEGADDEFCDGLGISLEYATDDNGSHREGLVPLPDRPIYWLILIVKDNCVEIVFFSKLHKMIDIARILQRITNKLSEVEKRTNQLMLLRSLHESRRCSKYLEVSSEIGDEESSASELDSDSEDDDGRSELNQSVLQAANFTPGQFRCPVVFKKQFPLHWRLQPNMALRYLTTDVLQLFTIQNRRHMFVVERDDTVVYCKIYENDISSLQGAEVEATVTSPSDEPQLLEVITEEENAQRQSTTSPLPQNKLSSVSSTSAVTKRRELVLEVHGIHLPTWIEKEFVDLIENRLVSHITLNEIQQFFLRNPTSRPTKEDVDFILPFNKPRACREVLRIPAIIHNLPNLMLFFKHLLLTDNIKQFHGSHVVEAVQAYYNSAFSSGSRAVMQAGASTLDSSGSEEAKEIDIGAYCFYYNCIKRIPGSSTALELAAGQGLAGICITPLDIAGMPVSSIRMSPSAVSDLDIETIQQCLENDFREASTAGAIYSICIDIWAIGAVDGDALLQHIYDCFRGSLCDYLIEKALVVNQVELVAAEIALHRNVHGGYDRRRDSSLPDKFVRSILYILQKASEWKSSTVCTLDQIVHTFPWCMDDIIAYIDHELCDIDGSLKPAVAYMPLNNGILTGSEVQAAKKWQHYKGPINRQYRSIQNSVQFILISGLADVLEKLGHFQDKDRRSSAASDKSSHRTRSRRSSGGSTFTEASTTRRNLRPMDEKSVRERHTAASTPRSMSTSVIRNRQSIKTETSKHSFLIMTLNTHRVVAYTYNWPEETSLELFNGLRYVTTRQETRNDILVNILHQKMGLFHHMDHIGYMLEKYGAVSRSIPSTRLGSATNYATPSQTKKAKSLEMARKTEEPSSGRQSQRNINTTSANASNILNLRDLVVYSTVTPSQSSVERAESGVLTKQVEEENEENRMLASIPCTVELDRALMDSIADPASAIVNQKNCDLLQRHGQPFLETYLRRTKLQSIHEKALKVYGKWRRRYGDQQSETGETEKLSRAEVATILRSSRVLHFCRTPLLFCNPDEEWLNMDESPLGRDAAINWYSELSNTLMSEYAKYLESIDMQLIDFAKTANVNEEDLRLSKFTVAKNVEIDCTPLYLLRVFEGGSIICEIRITNVFVSVTLYTLHRQYGRLSYRRFKREAREVKRRNFKKFEATSGDFKQLIHINSFVYDFHLRYIQKMLDQVAPLPTNLNVPNVIRRFALLNRTPACYARNRILQGFYEFESAIASQTFFGSLFRNAPIHGLTSLVTDNISVATFVSSNDTSFFAKDNLPSDWRHTLVICPTDDDLTQDASKIVLEYFILVVYQGPNTTETMIKNSWPDTAKNAASSSSDNPFADIVLPAHHDTLGNIITSARSRIDTVVAEVIARCKRVNDWSRLYAIDNVPKEDRTQLLSLIPEFDRVDLVQIDYSMAKFFDLRLNWSSVLDTVVAMKRNDTKQMDEDGHRHLFIYSARYMDFMIHLQVNQDRIQGWLVNRETNEHHSYTAEREQIANLGNMLCYALWKETIASTSRRSISS
ncbi:hypothetical protein EC973_006116 [Apophysomyces ossiformis]|uniref:Uncharacterized protein n=1 Tax=Apophysomyces ossiformis TaxID=679940 RepID=A0A8H7BRF5_9FUNG|nr:hypothetical protein EC973_006116 [Apophysomyces ossiformis]